MLVLHIVGRRQIAASHGRSEALHAAAEAEVKTYSSDGDGRLWSNLTPAAKTNSDKSAEYTLGSGLPTKSSAPAIPADASVALSAHSAEKQTLFPGTIGSP